MPRLALEPASLQLLNNKWDSRPGMASAEPRGKGQQLAQGQDSNNTRAAT